MTLSRKALFRICICLAVPLLLLVGTVELSRWRLLSYKEELKAKGEALDLQSLIVTVPPEIESRTRDFTSVGAEIASALKSSRLRFFTPPYSNDPARRSVFHRTDLPLVSGTIPYPWTEVEADCLLVEPALSRVREITRQGPLEIHPDYTLNYAAILPRVDEAQAASFALIGQSYLLLHKGNPEKAAENIVAAIRVAAMLYRQKTVVAQAIGMGLLNVSANATWDLLQAENLPDASLHSLQREWEAVRIIDTFKAVLRTERNFGLSVFAFPPPNALGPLASIGSPTDPLSAESLKAQSILLVWRTFYRHSDERQFLEAYQSMLESAPADPTRASWEAPYRAAETHIDRARSQGVPRLISKLLFPDEIFVLYLVAAQTQAHLAATAVAIRRYQLAHGALPERLDDLREQFAGQAPPPDLFNGQPLHYRKLSETEYLLYSAGSDFTDDGGSATDRRVLKSKDIVWPLPSKDSPAMEKTEGTSRAD